MNTELLMGLANTREKEEILLSLCIAAGAGEIVSINSPIKANIFRVAGSVILNNYPLEAKRLNLLAKDYFIRFPDDCLHASQIVRNGWIISYPRLRDMLIEKIKIKRNET